MDITNSIRLYAECISGGAITEPTGGSWISAIAIWQGSTEPLNASWLQRHCDNLGITEPVNGSWLIALSYYYNELEPINGTWANAILVGCNAGPVITLPTADFVGAPLAVDQGFSVTYTDLSTDNGGPPITSWSWSFEGGTPATSTQQNPVIQYDTVGQFDSELTVTNADGSDGELKPDYIDVTYTPILPTADFVGVPLTLNEGFSVTYTDLSSDNGGPPITSWSWSFEGGTPATSIQQNPVIQYNTSGQYDSELTVTNADGSDGEIKPDYIQVNVVPVNVVINSFEIGPYMNNLTGKSTTDFSVAAYSNNLLKY
tara:strand:- start:3176 stop:4120 length:945 start_codon:yes stop_codon:yes gene_type:complete